MPLVTKSETELLEESRRALRRSTTITNTAIGSTAGALLEIAATEHAFIHRQLDALQGDLFLSTATGNALDRIGEMMGTTRGRATRAYDDSRNVRFRIDPTTGDTAGSLVRNRYAGQDVGGGTPNTYDTVTTSGFVIKEGAVLTAKNGATYTTTQEAVFTGDDTEEFVAVIANSAGPSSNVSTGELNSHDIKTSQPELAALADFILVDNRMPITTGSLSESDESFRYRIQQAIYRLQAGNQAAIISAALSVPGVRNATYFPYSRGVQTFSVIIETTDPIVSDGMLAAARQAVASVTAAGSKGDVVRPTYKVIIAKVALRYRPEADRPTIRQRARVACVNYINSIPLGDPFILNELIQRIMDVDDKVLDLIFQQFTIGTYTPDGHIIVGNSTAYLTASNQTLRSIREHWYTSDRFFTVCDLA